GSDVCPSDLSGATLAAGAVVFLVDSAPAKKVAFVGRFEVVAPESLVNRGWRQLMRFSSLYTGILHNGFLRSYLVRIIIFAELLLAFELFKAGPLSVD